MKIADLDKNTPIKVMPSLPGGQYRVRFTAITHKQPDPQKAGYLQVDFAVIGVVALANNEDGTQPETPNLADRTGSLQIFPQRMQWSLTQLVDKTKLGVPLVDTDQLVGKECDLFFVYGYEDEHGAFVMKKQWNIWAQL